VFKEAILLANLLRVSELLTHCIVFQTAHSSAAALYNLAKNPDEQQKPFEELQRHLPDKDQPVKPDILNELRYLKACIKESMRYYNNKLDFSR
jgi:cytochrome P450